MLLLAIKVKLESGFFRRKIVDFGGKVEIEL